MASWKNHAADPLGSGFASRWTYHSGRLRFGEEGETDDNE